MVFIGTKFDKLISFNPNTDKIVQTKKVSSLISNFSISESENLVVIGLINSNIVFFKILNINTILKIKKISLKIGSLSDIVTIKDGGKLLVGGNKDLYLYILNNI